MSKTIVVRRLRKQVFDGYHGERFLSGKTTKKLSAIIKKNTRNKNGCIY